MFSKHITAKFQLLGLSASHFFAGLVQRTDSLSFIGPLFLRGKVNRAEAPRFFFFCSGKGNIQQVPVVAESPTNGDVFREMFLEP